ncbi:MAG TPA: class I SAM-dependent methyltransferase [Gaiellaceae bacterium]
MATGAEDTWAEAESALSAYLREHPDVERALLDSPLDSLNGADSYLRGTVLEARGADPTGAYARADEECYPPDFRAARDETLACVVELVRNGAGPILDVATGRGTLLGRLAAETTRALTATDVSPHVLRATERRVPGARYVVADAHSLPFADGEMATVVTHLGLGNVPRGSELLRELRRVGRELVATHLFYPEDDEENRVAARELALDELLARGPTLAAFDDAGWDVALEYEREVVASPTPESALIPGVRIDGLPVRETRATWCVLRAT